MIRDRAGVSIQSLSFIRAAGRPCNNPATETLDSFSADGIRLDLSWVVDPRGCGEWSRETVTLDAETTKRLAAHTVPAAAKMMAGRIKANLELTFAPGFAAIEGSYKHRVENGVISLHHIVMAPLNVDNAVLVPNEGAFGAAFHELLHAARKVLGLERPYIIRAPASEEILASLFGYCVAVEETGLGRYSAEYAERVVEYFDSRPVFAAPLADAVAAPGELDRAIDASAYASVRGHLGAVRWLLSAEGRRHGCNIDFFTPWWALDRYFHEIGLAI